MLKSFMKFFYFLFCFTILFGCASSEKSSYDSIITDKGNIADNKKPKRGISYLKGISQFEGNSFEFVTKQMKTVIHNYTKMKEQLIKIEDKLDELLSQLDSKNKLLQKGSGEEKIEASDPLSEEEKLQESFEMETSPLLDEEITDDTKIFPDEEEEMSLEEKYLQDQKNTKEEVTTGNPHPSLAEAKNLFKEKSYETAISKFQKYRDDNPKGVDYPEATFYIGQSFKKLKMPIEAEVFFKEIVQSYPNTLWASRAKKSLEE